MEIKLGSWQKAMLEEALAFIPADTREILEDRCKLVEIGGERVGNGHYHSDEKRVTLGMGITHPLYFIELVFHEIGHGLEGHFKDKDVDLSDSVTIGQANADALPLALFYPEQLYSLNHKEQGEWNKIQSAYRTLNLPAISGEFIEKYVAERVKDIAEKSTRLGTDLVRFAKEQFDIESFGYLARVGRGKAWRVSA